MPLTTTGHKVLGDFRKRYGKRGKNVFYASMNKGTLDRSKMEKVKKLRKKQ